MFSLVVMGWSRSDDIAAPSPTTTLARRRRFRRGLWDRSIPRRRRRAAEVGIAAGAAALGLGENVEFLPGADGGAVGDQRLRARGLRGHDLAVGVGAEADAAVGVVDE